MKSYSQKLPAGFRLDPHIVEPVATAPSAARTEDVSLAQTAPASLNP